MVTLKTQQNLATIANAEQIKAVTYLLNFVRGRHLDINLLLDPPDWEHGYAGVSSEMLSFLVAHNTHYGIKPLVLVNAVGGQEIVEMLEYSMDIESIIALVNFADEHNIELPSPREAAIKAVQIFGDFELLEFLEAKGHIFDPTEIGN